MRVDRSSLHTICRNLITTYLCDAVRVSRYLSLQTHSTGMEEYCILCHIYACHCGKCSMLFRCRQPGVVLSDLHRGFEKDMQWSQIPLLSYVLVVGKA